MLKTRATRLTILLLIIIMSSCAPVNSSSKTPEVTNVPTIAVRSTATETSLPPAVDGFGVAPAALKGLQIHFIYPWSGAPQQELERMVDQFNQTNEWGIHVIQIAPGSAAMEISKTWEGIANQQAPNVIATPLSFLLAIDEKDQLVVDLTPYVESAAYGLDEAVLSDFNEKFWLEDEVANKRYGIPAQRSALLMAYNNAWAAELGFESPPNSVEDFKVQACAANAYYKKDEDTLNDGLGGWLIDTGSDTFYSWLFSLGAEPFVNGQYRFSNEASDAALRYLFDLKAKSCAWSGTSPQVDAYFANRQALLITVWMQDLPRLTETMNQLNPKDALSWTVLPFPSAELPSVLVNGSSYGILRHNAEEDLASWLFIRWLSQPEQQIRLLKVFRTLPLSLQAQNVMDKDGSNPQWKAAVDASGSVIFPPADADWQVVHPVLEDASWQLFKTEITAENLPSILIELDSLAKELGDRYP